MQLTPRFRDALTYAFDLHQTQERKGSGVPYMAHLLGVSSLAMEHGADEDGAIAALLHDAVEDQGGLAVLEEIRSRFGERVAAIVSECTDSTTEPKPPWRARKELYVEHLSHAPPEAQLVSACDKLYNARAILADYQAVGEEIWARFSGGREGVLWYYRALVGAFSLENSVKRELDEVVTELEACAAEQQ